MSDPGAGTTWPTPAVCSESEHGIAARAETPAAERPSTNSLSHSQLPEAGATAGELPTDSMALATHLEVLAAVRELLRALQRRCNSAR